MMQRFDFDQAVDRHGSWCTQWDFVADRFGVEGLLPFTISDMDFATAPCIIEALHQRLNLGVLGFSRWQQEDFTSAIQHWMQRRFATEVEAQSLIYGPSVIYMVAHMLRHWTKPGDEVLIPEPCYVSYVPCVELADGIPVIINLKEENQFRLTKEELLEILADR